MADGGHVHPDLMGAPGLKMDIEETRRAKRLDGLVVRHTRPPPGDDREPVVRARMTVDRGVDGATAWVGMALHECGIALVNAAVLEGTLELGIGALALGDDHDTCRPCVKAMHHSLTLRSARGGNPISHGRESSRDRGPGPAWAGMGRDTDR